MTLKNMMNVIFVSSGVLLNLCGKALLFACYIRNRIPHKKTGNVSYELWKGYVPNLICLKVWLCHAKVHINEPKKRKLGPKTIDCMFPRYTHNSAANRFVLVKSNIILVDEHSY